MTGPMVAGIVAILFFNLVDTWWIAQMGTHELAAVSMTFPVSFVITSLAMGLGVGLSASLGRSLGQGNHEAAGRFATHGVLLAVLLVSLLSATGLMWLTPLFRAMGADDTLMALIRAYMVPWFLGVPLLVVPLVGNSALRATGDTRTPGIIMALAGLANGVLDPLLMFGIGPFPELGIQGAAIASILSWLLALIAGVRQLHRRDLLRRPQPGPEMLSQWRRILAIGMPAAVANLLAPLTNAIIIALLARTGVEAVAAWGASNRVEALLLIGSMAVSSVLPPITAQNMGAGQPERVHEALSLALRGLLIWQALLYILLWLAAPWVAHFFSDDPGVSELIVRYLRWIGWSWGLLACVYQAGAIFNGLGEGLKAMGLQTARLVVLALPLVSAGIWFAGVNGAFAGMAAANTLAGLFTLFWVRPRLLSAIYR